MTIQDIIASVTEPDEYRRQDEIKRRISDWAVSKLPAVSDGMERTITAIDYEAGTATYVDTPITDRLAREHAADLAANGERYALQNKYLSMCDMLTGRTDHQKLGFAELQAAIEGMKATNPLGAMSLAVELLTLNAALVRAGGVQWWDNCEWTVLP